VADNYSYVEDAGDVWAPSDEMYKSLRGDCEDWAILLTSLLRLHT
jgi:transglutaminase-like putative cysteine protease